MVQDHRRGTKTLLAVTITDLYHGYGPDIANRSGDRVSVSWKEKVVTVQQPRREIGQLKGDFLGEQTRREIWRLRQAIDIRSKTSGNYAKNIGKKVFWSHRLDSPEIWIGVEIKQVDSPKSAHLSNLDTNPDFRRVESGTSENFFAYFLAYLHVVFDRISIAGLSL